MLTKTMQKIIVWSAKQDSFMVDDLKGRFYANKYNIYKTMKELEDAGYIRKEKDGRMNIYEPTFIGLLMGYLLSPSFDGELEQFRNYLKSRDLEFEFDKILKVMQNV